MGAGPILAGVQGQQLLDLLQGEACRLGRADEAQAADILLPIAAHAGSDPIPGPALGRRHQAAALVEAHGLHAHAALAGQDGDGSRFHD